jgi:hypothetical protein
VGPPDPALRQTAAALAMAAAGQRERQADGSRIRAMMQKTLSAYAVAAALTLPIDAQPLRWERQQVHDEFLLTTGRAGRIELGTSVDEVYQMFGRDNVSLVAEFREGMFSPVLRIKLPGTNTIPAISTDIREWPCGEFSVWGITVHDARFRTMDGLGVGATARDLRRRHPFQITDEEGAHAAVVTDLKMTFSLTRQGPVDQQRIASVWIWPDPEAVRRKRCPGRAAEVVSALDGRGWIAPDALRF